MKNPSFCVHKLSSIKQLDQIISLIQGYQHFYLNKCLDRELILNHFGQLLWPSEKGFLLICELSELPVGFCTVYFLPSSLSCRNYACFNDLFVSTQVRGQGIGRALIQRASKESKLLGFNTIEWITKHDNSLAQKLYDSLAANKSHWCYYSMKTD